MAQQMETLYGEHTFRVMEQDDPQIAPVRWWQSVDEAISHYQEFVVTARSRGMIPCSYSMWDTRKETILDTRCPPDYVLRWREDVERGAWVECLVIHYT